METEHVKCALCGAEDAQRLFRPANSPGPVVRCRQCGLVYVNPREDQRSLIFDGPVLGHLKPSALNSANLAEAESSWEWPLLQVRRQEYSALRLNAALALGYVERYIQPPGKLLDFGCGGGFFLSVAAEHGWQTYGLEPLAGHAIHARAISGAEVVTDTLRDDTFPPEYFDVVTAFQVFEHLRAPSDELTRLNAVLKKDGLLLIEVPNIDTWLLPLMRGRHRHFVRDHLTFYSPRTLRMMVKKHGFEPLETYLPIRHMTLRHLLGRWVKQMFSLRLGSKMETILERAGLADKIISIGIRDIVAVVARKR